jgi:hypothetical protein
MSRAIRPWTDVEELFFLNELGKHAKGASLETPETWNDIGRRARTERIWIKISKSMITRDQTQVRQHFFVKHPGIKKGSWSLAEDVLLRAAVEVLGAKWSAVAERIGNRLAKQCRDRWVSHLDPAVSREAWQEEELERLRQLYRRLGPSWAEIAAHMPGRTDNAVKIQMQSLERKRKRSVSVAVPPQLTMRVPVPLGAGRVSPVAGPLLMPAVSVAAPVAEGQGPSPLKRARKISFPFRMEEGPYLVLNVDDIWDLGDSLGLGDISDGCLCDSALAPISVLLEM